MIIAGSDQVDVELAALVLSCYPIKLALERISPLLRLLAMRPGTSERLVRPEPPLTRISRPLRLRHRPCRPGRTVARQVRFKHFEIVLLRWAPGPLGVDHIPEVSH